MQLVLCFTNTANKPDKIKIEASSDLAVWTTVLQAGYDGGVVHQFYIALMAGDYPASGTSN